MKKKQQLTAEISGIDELSKKVSDIEALTEKARKKGAAAKESELRKAYSYESSLTAKDNEHRIDELKAELERLRTKYAAAVSERNELSEKLDACNKESRRLTSDTVRSISLIRKAVRIKSESL